MRYLFARLAWVLLALGAGACRRPVAPTPSRVVRDALGRAVALPARIGRVVSLAPSSTEILYAVGAGSLLVGTDRYSDWPPAARALPRVGADVDPNLESIVALRPDVVFTATSANTQTTAETLERLHLPVYVSRVRSLEEIYADVEGVGEAVGRGSEAREVVREMRARAGAVRSRWGAAPPVRALLVVWPEPLIVAGRASHVGDLVRAAGGENVADDSDQAFPTYSIERVLARAPSVIVVGTHSTGEAPPLAPLERLVTLPAVRDHRVRLLDGDLLFRPGPRVVDGIERLAEALHDGGKPPSRDR